MITVSDLSLNFSGRLLYDDVNLKFTPGNCYGIIGANGAGKSTFLKLLEGKLEPTTGNISIGSNERISSLNQDHFGFEEFTVMETVIQGHKKLYQIMKEKDAIYAKPDFSEEDGIKAAELEAEFAEMDGWNAEAEASQLLQSLGIPESLHDAKMSELPESDKVKVLLAQALFGEPDILLLDEPTNDLDIATLQILEDYLDNFPGAVIVVSHDRYFLDRICDKLFVFQNGNINQFIGGYSALMELGKQEKEVKEKKKGTKVQVIPRMTSKEKQELEEMEEKTSSLSEQLELIDEEMNQAGDDFTLIQELADKRAVMEKELEALMERWLYLEEKKEEIEEAKRK